VRLVKAFDHSLDLMAPTPGYERTPGLHASEIYNDYYRRLDPRRYDRRDRKGNPMPLPEDRVGFGTRFEEALEPQLVTRYQGYRPGELVTQHEPTCSHRYVLCTLDPSHSGPCSTRPDDRRFIGLTCKHRIRVVVKVGDRPCPCGAGIIYSPDYLFQLDGETILGEFKLTWMSSRGFPHDKKFAKWLTQIKFYARNLKLNNVWVFPFWVNGGTEHTYHECQPEFKKAYHLHFSDGECEQEHQRLVRHAIKFKLMEAYL
jgi:hypothetical protein